MSKAQYSRLGAISLVLALSVFAASGCKEGGSKVSADVPLFQVDWSVWRRHQPGSQFETLEARPGDLMMRLTGANSGDLLLARCEAVIYGMVQGTGEWSDTGERKQFPVYRYRPDSADLEEASQETWQSAGGKIADCLYSPAGATDLHVSSPKHQLQLRRRPIRTVAPFAVEARLSRSGRFAAVVSGEERTEAFLPFFSGGTAKGQHYHQILDVMTGEFQPGVVRIPLISEGGLSCCWSPDDRYIVYYKGGELVIVPFEDSAAAAR